MSKKEIKVATPADIMKLADEKLSLPKMAASLNAAELRTERDGQFYPSTLARWFDRLPDETLGEHWPELLKEIKAWRKKQKRQKNPSGKPIANGAESILAARSGKKTARPEPATGAAVVSIDGHGLASVHVVESMHIATRALCTVPPEKRVVTYAAVSLVDLPEFLESRGAKKVVRHG